MKNISLIVLTLHLFVPLTFCQSTPGVQLAGAIAKEEVEGDLRAAVTAYQKIAKDQSAPRDVRAKALLHLGGCYEKLGEQAQTVYQQVVRDFGDQPAAKQARARLAALKQNDRPPAPATMAQRKIETLGSQMGPGDTDGHRAVYLDEATGELIYGDLTGKSKRVIFRKKPDFQLGFYPSKDFSMVGLEILKPHQPETVAIVNTDGTGYREIAKLDLGAYGAIHGWSWDNRYLLCNEFRDGLIRLLIISVGDGQIRELVSLKAAYIASASFSPDGHFIAYEVGPGSFGGTHRVFVSPFPGGQPQLVYESTHTRWCLLDWTIDSNYLALIDAPKGKTALYLLPIQDGAPAGEPAFVRYGDFRTGSTTAGGALVYQTNRAGGRFDVRVGSFDSDGHVAKWQRLNLRDESNFRPEPSFSPDGTQVAYRAEDQDPAVGDALVLHDISSGKERVLYRSVGRISCQFAPHSSRLFCTEINKNDETDLISIAAESGELEHIASFSGTTIVIGIDHDEKNVYLDRNLSTTSSLELTKWDLAARQETILSSSSGDWVEGFPSLDDQWLIRVGLGDQKLWVRPISGGDWRSLATLPASFVWSSTTTPDGAWLLYLSADATGKRKLFRVPITGGPSQPLGEFPGDNGASVNTLHVSPDGRKVVTEIVGGSGHDLWLLENFVPPPTKR